MNQEVFFKNFELLADAPNGVQKLRELILQLAVMGKLVPQDPNDEPASVLIENIKVKKKVDAKGEVEDKSKVSQIVENEKLSLPSNWVLVRLSDIIYSIVGGGTPSKRNPDYWEGEIPWASVKDLGKGKYLEYTIDKITEEGIRQSSTNLIPKGRIIVCTRMGLGKIVINKIDVAINQDLKALHLCEEIDPNYFYNFYLTQNITGNGMTVKGIRQEELLNLLVPLPPLAEQKRIVSKVDELMALCDKLETRHQKKQELQSKLNSAALDRMLSAGNQEEFEHYWQRICENFDLLYDNPDNVGKLKQAILQLAVQGKLVEQNPQDEPASILIEKIEAEKKKLMKIEKIKGTKTAPLEITDNIHLIPENWKLVNLDSMIMFMDAGWSPACKNHPTEDEQTWGVLKTTSVQPLTFLWTEHKELPENLTPRPEYEVREGDILITRAGPKNRVGICCLVKDTRSHLMISDKIIRFHLLDEFVFPEFVTLCLNTGFSQNFIESQKSGMAESQMNISQNKLRMTPVPLPPLEEQKRIVEKVEQFRGLCDELESKLRTSRENSEILMEAVVKGLLEGAAVEI